MNQGRGVAAPLGIAATLVLVLVVVATYAAPDEPNPLDPRSHEPGGTSALVALLREMGAEVDLDAGQPGDDVDVALVLRDRFDDDERDELTSWVRRGGILVVSDPGSELTPEVSSFGDLAEDGELGDDEADDPADQPDDTSTVSFDWTEEIRSGQCDIGALDDPDISWVDVFGGGLRYLVDEDAESCFGTGADGRAYVVATPEGDGTVVALGGSGILVNRTLDQGDNAPVAAALMAPTDGTRLAVFDPSVPATSLGGGDGDESLWSLVPDSVWRAVVQLGAAFLVYVVWRVRRVGRPVAEPQPVKVAGSELVSAVGGLLERARSPQHAADVLRAELRRDLIVQLGVPANVSTETLAQVLATRTGLDEARLQAALGPAPVTTDRDLVLVAQIIDFVRKEAFDHVGT